MGKLTKRQRSYCMSHIRSKDTIPELKFRKYIWGKGIRGYRLKNKIAGKPDLYFGKIRLAVFIDGCFWHKCLLCFIRPKSNLKYWIPKINSNIKRDKIINRKLKLKGIKTIRFWEHEIKQNIERCFSKLRRILEKEKNN